MGRLGFNFLQINEQEIDCECNAALVKNGGEDESAPNESKSPCQADANKKIYLLIFISISLFTGFCIFVVIPQLMEYYTGRNELSMDIDQKQTVIELLDTEKSRKHQERLDVLEKFDALQRNYKILQAKYEKAKEIYLAKLHGSYAVENMSS